MQDFKHLGDSDVTIRQRQREQKPSLADRLTWGLIIISMVYFIGNAIIWGLK